MAAVARKSGECSVVCGCRIRHRPTWWPTLALTALLAATAPRARATVELAGDAIIASGPGYRFELSARNGAIEAVRKGPGSPSRLRSGEHGLWLIRFADGTTLDSTGFSKDDAAHQFTAHIPADDGSLRLVYECADAGVTVDLAPDDRGLAITAKVRAGARPVLDLQVPARLRFEPEALRRLIVPSDGNQGVGLALNSRFFSPQPQDQPVSWAPTPAGPAAYESLLGGPLVMRADQDPAVPLSVTPEGREWLGASLAATTDGARAMVNRPSAEGQLDRVLVTSAHGPYFGCATFGGQGGLWRIGGGVGEGERDLARRLVEQALTYLCRSAGPARPRLGLVTLTRGPERGGWVSVDVAQWRQSISTIADASGGRFDLVELTSPDAMLGAMRAGDFLCILNPYGEWLPIPAGSSTLRVAEAIGRYVREGGHWFEVGGYSFYAALEPLRYLNYQVNYPAAFADFMHCEGEDGTWSIYGVQPLPGGPWTRRDDPASLFVPGHLGCGGDTAGGYLERGFATYIPPGTEWPSPAVRLDFGCSVADALSRYGQANNITRRLNEKMPPETLERFRQSVLIYYGGSAREKLEYLEALPRPALIHFADYLKGGFDKEYPNHLPPHADFGTPADLKELFDRAHALGHLVMPYTNPTWWCDHPRGPTFDREGEHPLLRGLDGQLSYERYGSNDGFTVCHWHPAVQAANRETRRQFTEELPVDVLFQDQCGARSWRYDTNPASPTPYAYIDGLLSMVDEDSQVVPLSTESGWDHVAQFESQLCGMSWGLVPTEFAPEWRVLMKNQVPPDTWEVFPLAQHIAHDKTAMVHHDLGQFVTNRETLTWTLALGFCMSARVSATALASDPALQWLRWLDRVQKSICARYLGEPVRAFAHDRGPNPTAQDDGAIDATYGNVRIRANLGPATREVSGVWLPPFGFDATGPGLHAGELPEGDTTSPVAYVAEFGQDGGDLWLRAPGQVRATLRLPFDASGRCRVTLDEAAPIEAQVADGVLTVETPPVTPPGTEPIPPEIANLPRSQWPGPKPAIGVIDLGPGAHLVWTRITPAEWVDALSDSRLVRKHGLQVRRLANVDDLLSALSDTEHRWFAIVNPYGEAFPVPAKDRWHAVVLAVRRYVQTGGCWWETGGHPFFQTYVPDEDGWRMETIGSGGADTLGIPVGAGDVDQPPEPLRVTDEGARMLGQEVTEALGGMSSTVNRALPSDEPAHVSWVAGQRGGFIGGYRLNGWGWLCRIGGFWPNRDVAIPVVVRVLEQLYDSPAAPGPADPTPRLWHFAVERAR